MSMHFSVKAGFEQDKSNGLEMTDHKFLNSKPMEQVYLLMLMERATLPHTKSTISSCTPIEITRQQTLRAIFKAHCDTDCHLLVISTHIHGAVLIQ